MKNWIIDKCVNNYPVGSNGLWHGGIHILPIAIPESERWIKPLIAGTVVAGKIQDKYYTAKYNGEDVEYSTSYVLFEHSVKFKLDEQNGNSQDLDFNFFSLYMHLLPYKNYTVIEEIKSFDLPFYLSWDKITITSENNELPIIKKIMTEGQFPLYHGSIIEIDENRWFDLYNNNEEIKVKIKPKSDDDEINKYEIKSINKRDIKQLEQKKEFKVIPADGSVPIYCDPAYRDNIYYIGRIKRNAECTVYIENNNNMKRIGISKNDDIEDASKGVLFDKLNANKVLTYDVVLYTVTQMVTKPSTFVFLNYNEYLRLYEEDIRNLEVKKNRNRPLDKRQENDIIQRLENERTRVANAIKSNNNYIVVEYIKGNSVYQNISYIDPDNNKSLPDDFCVLVRNNKEFIAVKYEDVFHLEDRLFNMGEVLQPYQLKKNAILKKGLKLKEGGNSGFLGRSMYTVDFAGSTAIYTNVTRYKAKMPIYITVDAKDSPDSEQGIACYDYNGYIRNLLKHKDCFRYISGNMKEGQIIYINYPNSGNQLKRYIYYNKQLLFGGENKINNEFVDTTSDNSTVLLKKDKKVYTSDILGRPGKFIGRDELCHLEVFMKTTDTQKIEDLFEGKYVLNAYIITSKISIYEKDKDKTETAVTENKSIFRLLKNQNDLPRPHIVYGYQLECDNGHDEYYRFIYNKKEYFIKKADKEKIAENKLNFGDYFIKSDKEVEDDKDIFCDDDTIDMYNELTKGELKKYVCKFPIEWDGSLYERCTDRECGECNRVFQGQCNNLPQKMWAKNYGINGFPDLSDIMKKADIRQDVDFLKKDTKVWHFHPIAFYNRYVELLKTQMFNPYEKKEFLPRRWPHIVKGRFLEERNLYEITSNPGFAPLWNNRTNFEGNIFDGFALLTGFFNQEYYNSATNLIYPHEGVDFRGDIGREIVSFIYGKVIMVVEKMKFYGTTIIIEPLFDTDIIYLLGHLSETLVIEGEEFGPYKIVAKVGNTGNAADSHLHVSVLKNNKYERGKILKENELNELNPNIKYLDPFNHHIERETWRK